MHKRITIGLVLFLSLNVHAMNFERLTDLERKFFFFEVNQEGQRLIHTLFTSEHLDDQALSQMLLEVRPEVLREGLNLKDGLGSTVISIIQQKPKNIQERIHKIFKLYHREQIFEELVKNKK